MENPNSVSQLKGWLEERGIEVSSLGKKDVAAMIKEIDKGGLDQEALDMLKLRLQMAKSSVKKYQAIDRYICPDGRAHGLFHSQVPTVLSDGQAEGSSCRTFLRTISPPSMRQGIW